MWRDLEFIVQLSESVTANLYLTHDNNVSIIIRPISDV